MGGDLCTYDTICPDGDSSDGSSMLNEEINYHDAFIGTYREDDWTPYLDEENYWVQTGEDAGRPCHEREGSDGNWHADSWCCQYAFVCCDI